MLNVLAFLPLSNKVQSICISVQYETEFPYIDAECLIDVIQLCCSFVILTVKSNSLIKVGEARIYVSGVNPDISNSDLHSHFAHYGEVTDVYQPLLKEFAFVTFKGHRSIEFLIGNPSLTHRVKGI